MTASKTTNKTTTRKAPSAAEKARREAQSKTDTGAPAPKTIEVKGISLTVAPEDVDDYDAMIAMEGGDFRPMLLNLANGSEDRREEILSALREESGRLRYSTVVDFVNEVMTELSSGN